MVQGDHAQLPNIVKSDNDFVHMYWYAVLHSLHMFNIDYKL
jgi:hypothetical protein